MKIILVLLTLFLSLNAVAQNLEYARAIVDTLASDGMKGRGYVGDGDKIAANFISNEFEKIGLIPYSKNYLQKFSTPVNTFPGSMSLKLNGEELTPGKDYLIDPGSPSMKGSFETVSLTAEDLLDEGQLIYKLKDAFGKFLVIEPFQKEEFSTDELKEINDLVNFLKFHEDNPALGTIVLSKDKLTWSGATAQLDNPAITVKVDSLFKPVEKVELNIEAKFYGNYKTQNVLGYLEGKSNDSLIVLVAHYDHLGMMGEEAIFPGANDNASGIAMLLSLAKYYKANQPNYTTVFIAFGGEELGLLGSRYFTENPAFPLKKIKFLVNFDISGTGDDGIQVVNGSVYKEKFDRLKEINQTENLLQQVKIRGEACNSDHCMFHLKGVPSFFIYTLGGIQAYHDVYDRAETLPLTEFEDYFTLMTRFIDGL